jgi:hypothetical protein
MYTQPSQVTGVKPQPVYFLLLNQCGFPIINFAKINTSNVIYFTRMKYITQVCPVDNFFYILYYIEYGQRAKTAKYS